VKALNLEVLSVRKQILKAEEVQLKNGRKDLDLKVEEALTVKAQCLEVPNAKK